MMLRGCCCCCCYSPRHRVVTKAGGKAKLITRLLLITLLCSQIISAEDSTEEEDQTESSSESTPPFPSLSTVWLATYRASTTDTVTNDCGKHYASYFLQEFLKSADMLQETCTPLNASISISSVARVRLLVSKSISTMPGCNVTFQENEISLDTFLTIEGNAQKSIETCLQFLNTSLQNIRQIANVGTIPHNSEYNCSEVEMMTDVLEWTRCTWECKGVGYVYNGSSSCQGDSESYSWDCTQSCKDKFGTCLTGIGGRSNRCQALNRGLVCIRNRRYKDPARYAYCWHEIKDSILERIREARQKSCEVDDSDIDPTENICTSTTPPETTTTTTTETSTTSTTMASTARPLEWSLELDDVSMANNFVIELLEGGPAKNITVQASINMLNVCEMKTNCLIYVDIKFSDRAEPKCRSTGNPISQVVVGHPLIDGVEMPETQQSTFCKMAIPMTSADEIVHTLTIPIQARVDNKYDGNQTRMMTLSFRRQTDDEMVFLESTKLEIPVLTIDRDNIATCSSINDPHITTFDGLAYDNFKQGEFVLYRNGNSEVHVVYQQCNPDVADSASCNCAVTVRTGDDVFIFDRCRRAKPKFFGLGANRTDINIYKVTLIQNGELTRKTTLHDRGEGKKYLLYFPSGTFVKVLTNEDLLNVWIIASTLDIGKTEGLCGVYDNDINNDLRMSDGSLAPMDNVSEFSESWRVSINGRESYLNGIPPATTNYEPPVYCRCGMDSDDCDYELIVETCDIYEGEDVTEVFEENAIPYQSRSSSPSGSRRKRNVDDTSTIIVDPNFTPTKYDWEDEAEENEATDFCKGFIRDSHVGQLCSMVPGVDFSRQVEICTEDIKISKSKSWAESANTAMKESCLEQVKKNGSIPDDLARQITGAICVADCSGHGTCVKGVCVCNPGRSGAVCSVSLEEPPVSAELPRYGLCDRKLSDCDRVIVYGENFLDSPQLICILTAAFIYQSGYDLGNTTKEGATFINFNAVECPIAIIRPYIISVSNDDGLSESEPLLYIPYDSTCRICSTNITGCQLKMDSCYIQENCYKKGQTNSENSCLVCQPDRPSQWSDADTCSAPLYSDVVVVAISAAFGSLLGLALGVLLYIFCCKRKVKGEGIPMDNRDIDQFTPTMQPENEDMLHRNTHVVPSDFSDPESIRENFRGGNVHGNMYDYSQGVENGVDDTTYF